MIEDIIELYKEKCTHIGQFSLIYNIWFILIIIIGFGLMFGIYLSKLLYDVIPKFFLIYTLLIPIIIIEIIYLLIVEYCVFRRQKKYIIKTFDELISNELDEKIKCELENKMKKIQRIHFNRKYYFISHPISKLYNIIKFDEFLSKGNIRDANKLNKTKKELNKHIAEIYNTNNYFKLAFIGISSTIVLAPIVEYAQSVYIPQDAIVFVWKKILLYLLAIAPFILIAISIEYFYKKLTFSIKIKEKRILKNMLKKLENVDINKNIIDKCLEYD